jgi:uncharacterized protein (DUF1697 family)
MKTYILLLRGVMPMGKNRVPMAQLREVLAADGFGNVRTYIASGNALVDTELSAQQVEVHVHDLIRERIGPDLVVVARTASQLKKTLDHNPFKNGHDLARVFFVLFAETPAPQKVKELLAGDFAPEELVIQKDAAYMYIPEAYGRNKLSNNYLERKLGVPATTRNFNTLEKLIRMSQ